MYTIGLDFGTLSGRAVLVDTRDGAEIAEAVFDYPHAVMDEQLPSGVAAAAGLGAAAPEGLPGCLLQHHSRGFARERR